MISVPITAYVKKYLLYEHGPGPYDLTQSAISKLRFEFKAIKIYAANYTSLYTHETCLLKIENSPSLKSHYQDHKKYFERGIFCVGAFFSAFENQVVIMHDMMNMSYEDAIEKFQEKYSISEEEYAFDNMWRQFCRIQRRNRIFQGNRRWDRGEALATIRIRPTENFFSTK